ncbi:MAG TPA: hypothetical protein VIM73_23015 [Polyangiaceae bacterium]
MKPIVFAPDARAEFEAAVEWYEAKAAGLGERFISYVHEVLQLVEETPGGFPTWTVDPRFRRGCAAIPIPRVLSRARQPD